MSFHMQSKMIGSAEGSFTKLALEGFVSSMLPESEDKYIIELAVLNVFAKDNYDNQ